MKALQASAGSVHYQGAPHLGVALVAFVIGAFLGIGAAMIAVAVGVLGVVLLSQPRPTTYQFMRVVHQ
jgi:uncharacterized membrane protein (DUF4010 family)